MMLDLFSGIGGFSLAAKWCWGDDLEIVSFVEMDPFCQKVLAKNFPGVPIHDDIKTFKWPPADTEQSRAGEEYSVDLLTGGFPCQPFSHAGKRGGTEDNRYLWPEMLRVIRMVRPRWVVAENVPGLVSIEDSMVFEQVCTDLESENYKVQPFIIPACGVNAPHRRDRVWIVAHSKGIGSERRPEEVCQTDGRQNEELHSELDGADCHAPDTCHEGLQGCQRCGSHDQGQTTHGSASQCISAWDESWYSVALRTCVRGVAHGSTEELHKLETSDRVGRLKALGNAIVPQVVYQILKAIKEVDG